MCDLRDCHSFCKVVVSEFGDDLSFSDKRGRSSNSAESTCMP